MNKENSRKGGISSYKNKSGIHRLTQEQRSDQGKKNAERLTHIQRSKGGKIAGNLAYKNKTGIHAIPKEVKQKQAIHAAKYTKDTVWCTNIYTMELKRIPRENLVLFLEENILEWRLGYFKKED